jgi:hypothetical protein
MKKIAVVFLGIMMSVMMFGSSVAYAGSASLSLSTDASGVAVGDSFSVMVDVDPNGTSLDTVRVDLSYDPLYVEVSSYTLGELFPYESPSNEIDNSSGVLSYGGYKFGDAVTEAGVIATVTFVAIGGGDTSITISDDSRLISDGVESLDTEATIDLVLTISGEAAEVVVEETTEETTEEVIETTHTSDPVLEAEALVYFGAFYARMPSNSTDWEALHCIAYGGCQGDPRDVAAEAAALELFGQKYAKMPESHMEWNVLHTIAYTDLLTYTQEDTTTEETSSQMSVEEQAIGWFGTLTGYLPTSDADWLAIDYMVNGYFPEHRDLDAEVSAIAMFTEVFGYEPDTHQDWNIVSAIAYSGTFRL